MHEIARSERQSPVSPRKVLVIDDDPALSMLFDALLSRVGFEVDHANDGGDGLAMLDGDGNGDGDGYSAIILDLMMPNLGGLELLDHLSKAKPNILKKIIVATGASRAYLEKVDSRNIHALIRKPFDIEELVRAVLTCGENDDA